jgi:hypothetical protein
VGADPLMGDGAGPLRRCHVLPAAG